MTGDDLIQIAVPRISKLDSTSGLSAIDALNIAVSVVFMRLLQRRSALVISTLAITSASGSFALPTGFRGIVADPYLTLTDETITLLPLPQGMEQELYGESDVPEYYRVEGLSITVFPGTTTEYVMRGQYFVHPGVLTGVSTVPWLGMFDDVLVDAMIEAVRIGGFIGVIASQPFMNEMFMAVDLILSERDNPGPVYNYLKLEG
jgi:hypothetical protein